MYEIKAIPTIYKGIQFRSRLEARWAAFFDLLGWKWAYEPFDLNGWIPDFILGDRFSDGALVEVKPIDWPDQMGNDFLSGLEPTIRNEISLAVARTPVQSRGLLVCGLRPIWLDAPSWWDKVFNGPWVAHSWEIGPVWEPRIRRWIQPSARGAYDTGLLDFPVGDAEPYLGLATGRDYTSPDCSDAFPLEMNAQRFWNEAGNITQWKRRS